MKVQPQVTEQQLEELARRLIRRIPDELSNFAISFDLTESDLRNMKTFLTAQFSEDGSNTYHLLVAMKSLFKAYGFVDEADMKQRIKLLEPAWDNLYRIEFEFKKGEHEDFEDCFWIKFFPTKLTP